MCRQNCKIGEARVGVCGENCDCCGVPKSGPITGGGYMSQREKIEWH